MGDRDRTAGAGLHGAAGGPRFPPPPPVFLHNPGVLTEGARENPLDVPVPGYAPVATAPPRSRMTEPPAPGPNAPALPMGPPGAPPASPPALQPPALVAPPPLVPLGAGLGLPESAGELPARPPLVTPTPALVAPPGLVEPPPRIEAPLPVAPLGAAQLPAALGAPPLATDVRASGDGAMPNPGSPPISPIAQASIAHAPIEPTPLADHAALPAPGAVAPESPANAGVAVVASASPWMVQEAKVEAVELPSNYMQARSAEAAPAPPTPRSHAPAKSRRGLIVVLGVLAVAAVVALVAVIMSDVDQGGFGDPLKLGAPEGDQAQIEEPLNEEVPSATAAAAPPPPPPSPPKPPPPPESIYDTPKPGPAQPTPPPVGAQTGTGAAPTPTVDKFDPQGI